MALVAPGVRGDEYTKQTFLTFSGPVQLPNITLPAGTYTVKRFSQQPFDTLMLTSDNKRTSVFIHPAEMEDASDEKPKVSFHRVGEQHFLSAIETADYVYNFTVSRSLLLEAAAKQRDVVPASASGGSK